LNEGDKNIINMAEARKRQQTLRKGANGKNKSLNGGGAKKPGKGVAGFSILSWLQFILFLVFLSYVMRHCGGS
jgi:hypothetical protein